MRFAVISGSREWTEASPPPAIPPRSIEVNDVQAEARRRLSVIKLEEWRVREFVTGVPMPDTVRHLALQIDFAAQAIGRLSPIPADFADDVYWPRVW
ncbi:hypothetical protein SAMN05216456_1374 [Devosia crocina]|uniref:Uncharacterized protein n=1 Tax=Devosia crocina TaxID=429728 RepID=A0A1I7NA61_9HYPH|nr:hypothetical protein [Devosia crocina]SFV31545.1 hypothetical protein SAMN05216456_1374 [Devosia crocina]